MLVSFLISAEVESLKHLDDVFVLKQVEELFSELQWYSIRFKGSECYFSSSKMFLYEVSYKINFSSYHNTSDCTVSPKKYSLFVCVTNLDIEIIMSSN